jgi:hypothetical protein
MLQPIGRYNNRGIEVMGLYELNFKNRIGSLFTEDYEYLFGGLSPNVPQS